MAFVGGCLAVGKAAPFFGPVGLFAGAVAVGLVVVLAVAKKKKPKPQRNQTTVEKQDLGEIDSSQVENDLQLGVSGSGASVRKRCSTDPMYLDHAENDHLPPISSLKRAIYFPEFDRLEEKNEVLYNMVIMALNEEKGRLFVIRVGKQHHRAALSTGSNLESKAARLVVAHYIARGEPMTMLKLAMIIAHPFASQNIRAHAEIVRSTPTEMFQFKDERTRRIYQEGFRSAVEYYYRVVKILNDQDYKELMKWVDAEGYLDATSSEFKEILKAVKISEEKKKKNRKKKKKKYAQK